MGSTQTRRVIAAGMIGNVLEWYDFAIYGYFAASIGRHFFPHEDPVAQLLSAFGVFALGYLMRPVGGAIIGHIGDRFGRRAALTFSVAAMAIPTFLIGLLPGYATLGILRAGGAHAAAHGAGAFGRRRIYQLDGVPGRARAGGPPRPDGRAHLVRRRRRHPARLGGGRGFRGEHVGRRARRLGLAHSVPDRPAGGIRRIFSAPARARDRAGGAARAGADRRDAAGPLADSCSRFAGLSVYNAVGFYVSFVYLVSWMQVADGIPPDRALEINSVSMALLLPVMIATGLLDRPLRPQALPPARVRPRLRRRAAAVLAVEPALGALTRSSDNSASC